MLSPEPHLLWEGMAAGDLAWAYSESSPRMPTLPAYREPLGTHRSWRHYLTGTSDSRMPDGHSVDPLSWNVRWQGLRAPPYSTPVLIPALPLEAGQTWVHIHASLQGWGGGI